MVGPPNFCVFSDNIVASGLCSILYWKHLRWYTTPQWISETPVTLKLMKQYIWNLDLAHFEGHPSVSENFVESVDVIFTILGFMSFFKLNFGKHFHSEILRWIFSSWWIPRILKMRRKVFYIPTLNYVQKNSIFVWRNWKNCCFLLLKLWGWTPHLCIDKTVSSCSASWDMSTFKFWSCSNDYFCLKDDSRYENPHFF